MSDNKPFIIEINDIPDIFDSKNDLIPSLYLAQPLIKLGFHTYLHQNKAKMSDSKLKESNFYLVTNPFEHIISDNTEDLKHISEKYFGSKPSIVSRSFYKIWEILFYFNLIKDNKDFLSTHLADGPGSFIQAVMYYREKFNKAESKKDNYCAVLSAKNNTIECFQSGKLPKFITNSKHTDHDTLQDHHQDDGNISNTNTIKSLKTTVGKTKKLAKLITASGDLEWKDVNFQEQESYRLLLGEIIAAVNVQDKGGNFVLKIFDTFTGVTLKYICILKSLYNKVYICKPLTSRKYDAEKYIVCLDFKHADGKKSKIMDNLMKVLEGMNDLAKKQNYVQDIFSEYEFSSSFIDQITKMNIKLSCEQYDEINKIMKYKNGGNYFGELYHKFKDEQIAANKWWTETFYPEPSTIKTSVENAGKLVSA